MSGVGVVLGAAPGGTHAAANRIGMAMPDRGPAVLMALQQPFGSMVAATAPWQEELNGGSTGRCGDVVVVADATLYYRHDLVEALGDAGIQPQSLGAADLIAAAVVAWDDDAAGHLEGDFAYVAVRVTTRRGHAARDPVGTRPLFLCLAPWGVAFSSSPRALVSAGLASAALNLDWLAELCSGTVSVGSETAFRDVAAVRQGERVRFREGRRPATDSWWNPPAFTESGTTDTPFDDAALELRGLIVDAVRERLDPARPTFVSLSGGRDSSAVYAAGRRQAPVRAVSLSYPPGDIGREDETILEVLARCGGEPRWIETEHLSLLGHLESSIESQPDAFRHPYEATSRAIADAVSADGSRVVLNGLGGDTLFHAELSFLADLALSGRWGSFTREWTALGGSFDPRLLFRWGVLPRLGPGLRGLAAMLRGGRRVQDVWDVDAPPWIAGGASAAGRFAERAWREPVRELRAHGAADRERRLMLLGPFAGRVVPEYARISLACGLEQRSPLYDNRIIRFAATRPRSERQTGGDYKRLLRASMAEWLPTSVTGPRHSPTGFAGSYFRRSARHELPQLVARFGPALRVADLGLVLASGYRAEVRRFAETGDHPQLPALVFTALTESWLRRQGQVDNQFN